MTPLTITLPPEVFAHYQTGGRASYTRRNGGRMPNWTLLRLREKAKGKMSEGLFCRLELKALENRPKTETVDEFLKRGGIIRRVDAPTERR